MIHNCCEKSVIKVLEIIKDMKRDNDEEILLNVKSIGEANKLITKIQSTQEKIVETLAMLMHKFKYIDT